MWILLARARNDEDCRAIRVRYARTFSAFRPKHRVIVSMAVLDPATGEAVTDKSLVGCMPARPTLEAGVCRICSACSDFFGSFLGGMPAPRGRRAHRASLSLSTRSRRSSATPRRHPLGPTGCPMRSGPIAVCLVLGFDSEPCWLKSSFSSRPCAKPLSALSQRVWRVQNAGHIV